MARHTKQFPGRMPSRSILGRRGATLAVSAGLLALAGMATAQTPPKQSPLTPDGQAQITRTVVGTVKTVAPDGLVIEERRGEGVKGKAWSFVLDAGTQTRSSKGGEPIDIRQLRPGDPVAVTFADRSGKIVAQSITRLDGAQR